MKNRTALTLTIINSVILLVIAFWFLFGRFFITPTDSFTILLVDVGSIMGAIFAAGGLVVALVSIFTLFSIDSKVEQGFNAAYEKLRPELLERTDRQIRGHLNFLLATEAGNWESAEKYAKKALEHYPQLEGVRSYIGRKMSEDVAEYFLRGGHNKPTEFNLRVSGLTSSLSKPPLTEAIQWLEDALAQGEDINGELWVILATMYGVNHRLNKMKDAITKALNIDPTLKAQFCQSDRLILLVHGCNNNEQAIQTFGKMLDLTLPVPQEIVCKSIENANPSQPIDWLVIKQPYLPEPQPEYPITLRFFGDREDSTTIAGVYILDPTKTVEQVPPPGGASRPLMPIKELVAKLAKRFAFIAEH